MLIPEPCYVAYEPCVSLAGGKPVTVATSGTDGFRLHADRIAAAITPRTKAILLSSPANPTGAVQAREDLAAVVELAVRHDLYLISDEIYERLSYLSPHVCVATLPGARERTILLGGFSKAYAMTGWRVGYLCAPAAISELACRIHQYTMLCASHISQLAALEALRSGEADADEMIADYDRRRRIFVKGLCEIGLDCPEPGGAFYAFPSISSTGLRPPRNSLSNSSTPSALPWFLEMSSVRRARDMSDAAMRRHYRNSRRHWSGSIVSWASFPLLPRPLPDKAGAGGLDKAGTGGSAASGRCSCWRYGRLDILVSNAGPDGPTKTFADENGTVPRSSRCQKARRLATGVSAGRRA